MAMIPIKPIVRDLDSHFRGISPNWSYFAQMGSQAITDEENMGDYKYDEYWREKSDGFFHATEIHKNERRINPTTKIIL